MRLPTGNTRKVFHVTATESEFESFKLMAKMLGTTESRLITEFIQTRLAYLHTELDELENEIFSIIVYLKSDLEKMINTKDFGEKGKHSYHDDFSVSLFCAAYLKRRGYDLLSINIDFDFFDGDNLAKVPHIKRRIESYIQLVNAN